MAVRCQGERGNGAVIAADVMALRPRGHVECLHTVVPAVVPAARHGQRLAVRGEGEGLVLSLRSVEPADRFAGGRVPEAKLLLVAPRDQRFAVRREAEAKDRQLAGRETVELLARGHVPEMKR